MVKFSRVPHPYLIATPEGILYPLQSAQLYVTSFHMHSCNYRHNILCSFITGTFSRVCIVNSSSLFVAYNTHLIMLIRKLILSLLLASYCGNETVHILFKIQKSLLLGPRQFLRSGWSVKPWPGNDSSLSSSLPAQLTLDMLLNNALLGPYVLRPLPPLSGDLRSMFPASFCDELVPWQVS